MRAILSHHGRMATGGLDSIAYAVLGEGKEEEGAAESAKVGELWTAGELEAISKRAARDAYLTLQLWRDARGFYFFWKREG